MSIWEWVIKGPLYFLAFIIVFFIVGGVKEVYFPSCGPNPRIAASMAESIVDEINKRETPKQMVKLEALAASLPYILFDCKKESLDVKTLTVSKNGVSFKSKQTCSFQKGMQKYLVRLEYEGMNESNKTLIMKDMADMAIYVIKDDKKRNDFTEVIYRIKQKIWVTQNWFNEDDDIWLSDGDSSMWLHSDKWELPNRILRHRSRESDGYCKYVAWGH